MRLCYATFTLYGVVLTLYYFYLLRYVCVLCVTSTLHYFMFYVYLLGVRVSNVTFAYGLAFALRVRHRKLTFYVLRFLVSSREQFPLTFTLEYVHVYAYVYVTVR